MRTTLLSTALVAGLATSARAQPSTDSVFIEDRSAPDENGVVHDHWVARDADGVPLESEEFYRRVGRPDLADARASRRSWAIGTLVGGAALTGVSIYYLSQAMGSPPQQTCNVNESFDQFSSCVASNQAAIQQNMSQMQSNVPIGLGLLLGGGIAFGVSAYLFTSPEPISEVEAERIAADHNRRHISAVTPYSDGNGGGGLLVAGHF